MKHLTVLLVAFSAFFTQLAAQPDNASCHLSTEGTDFWFGFMEGRDLKNVHYLEITVCSRYSTTFRIYYGPDETPLGNVFQVSPGNPEKVRIPWEILEHFESDKIENKGIHLVSEAPVNLFALNWDQNSSDVATIFPTESLGLEYYAMCYTPNPDPDENGHNTEFLIVATEDATKIKITPSVDTHERRHSRDTTYEVTLNKGQSYQVQSLNNNKWPGQGDLTGSYILSDKPIAFFSGSAVAIVPETAISHTGDHLFEQMPPVQAWGREFLIIPNRYREKDRIRILALEDNTILWDKGLSTPDTLDRGEYKDTLVLWYQPKRIISEKPLLIAQYSQSNSEDSYNFSGGNFEPFMFIVSPVVQYRNNANFTIYEGMEVGDYFINMIFPSTEEQNIYLNNQRLTDLEAFDPEIFDIKRPASSFSNMYYAQIKVEPDDYTLEIRNSDKGLFAWSYSFGRQESFGYGTCFNLDNLVDLGSSINFESDTLLLCYGDTLTLDAGWWFEKFNWITGDTTQTIAVQDSGWYWVEVEDKYGCPQSDSVYVYMSVPVVDLGITEASGCEPFTLELDAGPDFEKYHWSTGENTQRIIADHTDTYEITVTNNYGCKARDTAFITEFPVPVIKLLTDSVVCDNLTGFIELDLRYSDNSPWDQPLRTDWWADDPNVIIDDKSDTSAVISVPDFGFYSIHYSLLTPEQCEKTLTINYGFGETPSAEFRIIDDENDPCKDFRKEILYVGEPESDDLVFDWDFGSSNVDTLEGWQHYWVSLGVGSNSVITLKVGQNGCFSDPFSQNIASFPETITAEADNNSGCDSLNVNFTSYFPNANVEYNWDFGDGYTSDEQNPSHFYETTGFYDVSLNIFEPLSGCSAGYNFEEMIRVYLTPTADFNVDPDQCYGDTLETNYLHSIDTTICFWTVNGNPYENSGNDSIKIYLDKQITTIGLMVNEYGCESVPFTKEAKRKPRFNFAIDTTEGCQPLNVYATALTEDDNLVYIWQKNRQNEGPFIATHEFLLRDTGYYDLGLITQSNITGCIDTVAYDSMVRVHVKPKARFSFYPELTYTDNSLITFTNLSEYTSTYFWNFGDGEYSDLTNPEHEYTEIGNYRVKLLAGTEFGCIDSAYREIKIIPYQLYTPNAFRPESEIDVNRYFTITGEGIDPDKFNLKIYDRWGQIVFESNRPEDKWDGDMLNGEPAPMGNYLWIARYTDTLGTEHELKGNVLLIR